jgi:hypothetical protein
MSKLFLRENGEPAQWALLEPNRNLVLFRIVPTEESCLLALLLLGNSFYWDQNLWSRFYGSSFFVNYFLTTGPLITWTSPYWTLNFRAKVHVLFAYLDLFWLRGKFIWPMVCQLTSLRTMTYAAPEPNMKGN